MSVRYRLKETQALCLTPSHSGLRIGTGNPGKLYEAGLTYADSGFVTSAPYDCTNPALFGTLSYRADVPAGTGLAFETRSGNSGKPDSTWSEWAAAAPQIASPSRRYIQWRCRHRTSFPSLTPELNRVDVYFRSANLAPVIRKLEISQPTLDDATKGTNKPTRQVTWDATDPDSDSLSFELFFREERETSWLKVGRDITDSRFDLDTRSLPDGWYELKLVAGDEPTEPAGAALTAERVSRPFVIDNTALSSPALLLPPLSFLSHSVESASLPKMPSPRLPRPGYRSMPATGSRSNPRTTSSTPWPRASPPTSVFRPRSSVFRPLSSASGSPTRKATSAQLGLSSACASDRFPVCSLQFRIRTSAFSILPSDFCLRSGQRTWCLCALVVNLRS
jgi:hypothetical protein